MEVTKQDWELFRQKLPGWQEAFMDKLNHEYVELLSCEGDPSDKFWALHKRLREDAQKTGVRAEMRRSAMPHLICSLLNEGAITMDDLAEFSEDLQEHIKGMRGWLYD